MVFLTGAAFGLALYLVNFQILGRLFFEWFQEGPNQVFEVFAHLGYGALLAPFVSDLAAAPAESAARRAAGSLTGARA